MRLSLLCYVWGKKINLLLLTMLANHLLSALLPCPIEPRAEMQVTGTPLYINKLQSKRQTHEEEISANTAWKKSPHHKVLILPLGLSYCTVSSPKAGLTRPYLYTELYSHLSCETKYLQLQCPGGAQNLLNTDSSSTCCSLLLAGKINRGREETHVFPCYNIINAFTLAPWLLRAGGMSGSSTRLLPYPALSTGSALPGT